MSTQTTAIAWTDRTWNPVRGCSRVSAGCQNCYAERVAARFSGAGQPYDGLAKSTPAGPRWTGDVRIVAKALAEPLSWRKAQRVFVNSMSDLFHEKLGDYQIDLVHAVMLASVVLDNKAPHTYQILTKRAARMRDYYSCRAPADLLERWTSAGDSLIEMHDTEIPFSEYVRGPSLAAARLLPLPNVHLGVSAEDQKTADERVPDLLACPAAVRWVSYEPVLGPTDFSRHLGPQALVTNGEGEAGVRRGLDWLVCGGESGPGARHCDVAWIREAVRQCRYAGVPVFVKQLGAQPGRFVGSTGEFRTDPETGRRQVKMLVERLPLRDRAGADPSEWPEDLRVQEWPR